MLPQHQKIQNLQKVKVQPKLQVNQPGDKYEREADAMADRVMRMSASETMHQPKPMTGLIGSSVQRKCAHCEEEEKRRKPVMRKTATGNSGMSVSSSFASSLNASKGSGFPLPQGTRSFMENAFSTDFSKVKIHTDSQAAELNNGINAKAFTYGSDIYFNSNQYSSNTDEGKQLLTHELTHVVQQGGNYNRLQRRVRESPVVRDFQTDAQVCMVHLHGDEQNAFHTAQDLHGRFCSNFVHLTYASSPERLIHVDSGSGSGRKTCNADPNRIFNDKGIDNSLARWNSGRACRNSGSGAKTELQDFRDNELMPAINACRAGANDTHLPIVAFHNNTNGALSINSYSAGNSESGAAETDAARLGSRANPHIQTGQDPDNFLLVTQLADFDALSASRNVVLQSTIPSNDGSLSVIMAGDRYINIESQEDNFVSTTNPFFAANLSAGEDVMHQLGVRPCPAISLGKGVVPPVSGGASLRIQRAQQENPSLDGGTATEESSELERLLKRILELLVEFIRYLKRLLFGPESSLRDPIPAQLVSRCRTFNSASDLDARKAHWHTVISGMSAPSVIRWIIGLDAPPRAVTTESNDQKNCLLDAIQIAATSSASGIQLPPVPGGNHHTEWTESSHRDFRAQRRIWERKYNFTGKPFDRITAAAVAACPGTGLVAGQQWDPSNSTHQTCWASLSSDQKQGEILQASSAPGISRHHWGADFDLFSVEPSEWITSGPGKNFADEYVWLQRNAASYGFIQSFTATSVPTGSLGYMLEQWHWSYYPVSQALLEFAQANKSTVQTALLAEWGSLPQFSLIRSQWSNFMFNVSSTAVF